MGQVSDTTDSIKANIQHTGKDVKDINRLREELIALANKTVRPYRVYTATLTQSGTSAPDATVLENTLGGTPVWSYAGYPGGYYMTLAGVFTEGKTAVFHNNTAQNGNSHVLAYWEDVNTIYYEMVNSAGTYVNNEFYKNHTIEVRVYD